MKEKKKQNGQWILTSLEVTLARGKFVTVSAFSVSDLHNQVAAISNQKTNPQYLEDRILSAHPDSYTLPTNYSRNI